VKQKGWTVEDDRWQGGQHGEARVVVEARLAIRALGFDLDYFWRQLPVADGAPLSSARTRLGCASRS
jgi:hypothetical protein